ncbi:MAG: AGE family epimerase/isomerase [Pseudomonadota bacterium]
MKKANEEVVGESPKVKPVILCGGSGTRLWPLSTPDVPKQFRSLVGDESMLKMTVSRLESVENSPVGFTRPLVVGSARHAKHLQKALPDADMILEPFGRNSAPAIAAACLDSEMDDYLLVLPSDHHIGRPSEFLQAISIAIEAAREGTIVTFGINPTSASSSYGYIQAGEADLEYKPVLRFVEKPDRELAEKYLAEGNFFWNAGIFMFKTSAMTGALARHAPDLFETIKNMAELREKDSSWYLDPSLFATVEDISIDFAVMEREENVSVVPVSMDWSDVGGYQALREVLANSPEAVVTSGPAIVEDANRVYLRSEGPLVCATGIENLTVVASDETVFIAPLDDAFAAKKLGRLANENRIRASLSSATKNSAKRLLSDALNVWAGLAWDDVRSGFIEQLNIEGHADVSETRRVRVQARQVFSFARAIHLGTPERAACEKLVRDGVQHLNSKCKHPSGGWVHQISAKGEIVDDTRDLYDHAFVILAGVTAFQALDFRDALNMAEEAIDYIDQNLADADFGGYFESSKNVGIRRSNPHMHLLEAYLAMYQVTGADEYLDRASTIVGLFERYFFDPEANTLREYFELDWSPAADGRGDLFEPGHHYEWATLLKIHDDLTGRDTLSWRRRLIRTADALGVNESTTFSYNLLGKHGEIVDENSRIWHQLERFRAYLHHPGMVTPNAADTLFHRIKGAFFDRAPHGTWIDECGVSGKPISTQIPASILYHVVTALEPAAQDLSVSA